MGVRDLPAMIDYIQATSEVEKISYIGHSQGTAQLFAAYTLIPDYFTKKLNGFIALGPITNLNYLKSSFLQTMAEFRLDTVFSVLGINEILPSPDSVHKFSTLICEKIVSLCDGLLELLADSNPNVDDKERLLVFVSHFPSGASLKTLKHYARIIRNKKFLKFDKDEEYNFDNIRGIPIALLVGKDDKLSTVEDSRILRNKLLISNVLHFYKEYDNMGHATFFLNKSKDHLDDVLRCLTDFQKFQ
jgi:pimeloyl-ACP methyl ester carboxylesterase